VSVQFIFESINRAHNYLYDIRYINPKGKMMLEKLRQAGNAAKDAVTKTTVLLTDLNGDGKVDEEDARIAAEWAKKQAVSLGNEAARLGKEAARSNLAKDAATGAVVGAAIAIPVPVIGPVFGAAIGATIGAYRSLTGKTTASGATQAQSQDSHGELLKLKDLREKGVLTEDEFQREKKRVLAN
jgi:hypothetical protein